MTLMERLNAGPPLLLDGAMGTELEWRGVAMDAKAWSASGMLGDAAVLRAVHRNYREAGAQVHIVNSFALARHVLEPAGLGERVAEVNRRAVEICGAALDEAPGQETNAGAQWIAGSLSTYAPESDCAALPRLRCPPGRRAAWSDIRHQPVPARASLHRALRRLFPRR